MGERRREPGDSSFVALQLRWRGRFQRWPRHQTSSAVQLAIMERTGWISGVDIVQSILLRLWAGESVMTSLQGTEPRLRLPEESKWSAISSAMNVLRSTSWRPFLRRLRGWAGWVGEPGGPERTEMLAMAPLRPERRHKIKIKNKPWALTLLSLLTKKKKKETILITVQCYGLSEGLQVSLHRTVSLWGRWATCRHHGNSRWCPSCSGRWDFATEETNELFSSDGSSAFLHPCNYLFISTLAAQVDTYITASLKGFYALYRNTGRLLLANKWFQFHFTYHNLNYSHH